MDRRSFLTLASGGLLAATPMAVEAQPTATVRKLVYVSFSPLPRFDASFNSSLRRLGWEEGRNIVVERRVVQSETTLADLAAEIARLAPDVIVVPNADIATVMRRAPTTIPIVVLVAGDLVAPGLVESLARPGRNVTGSQIVRLDLMGKRLQLLKEIMPHSTRVAALGDLVTTPFRPHIMRAFGDNSRHSLRDWICRHSGIKSEMLMSLKTALGQ